MDADGGEGGVKNQPKSADVVYGRPLLQLGNFLQFFSTNLEKIENINLYIFPCNSNKN